MIYRVEFTSETDNHQGFAYFATRKKAEAAVRDARRHGFDASITNATTPTTKAEVVALLHKWASHNNNG